MNADKHGLKDRNEAPKRDRELSKPIEMPINKPPPPLLSVHPCIRASVHPFIRGSLLHLRRLSPRLYRPTVGGRFCLMTTLAGWDSIRP